MWKYPYKTNPYEHQRNALNQSAEKVQWAYFMEMGTGKTKVTIDNMAYLYLFESVFTPLNPYKIPQQCFQKNTYPPRVHPNTPETPANIPQNPKDKF